ncbi:UDP-glucose 4-epimerase C-term subunit, partial [Palleronia marisminoris]
AAIEVTGEGPGVQAINVGSGRGHSVMEMIRAFEAASGRPVPYTVSDRRPGDIATSLADPTLAASRLNWRATRDLATMCADAWNWRSGRSG